MTNLHDNCCVCLNSILNLNKVSKIDENGVSLLTKLQSSIPQIEWHLTFRICDPCTNLLSIVHTFKERCFKSDTIRKQQMLLKQEQDIPESNKLLDGKTCLITQDDEAVKSDSDNNLEDPDYSIDDTTENNMNEEPRIPKRNRKSLNFVCEKCGTKYVSSTLLIKHCILDHKMTRKEIKPFGCTLCNSRFGNSSNLLQHIKYHNAVRSNMCTYCGKGFITKTDLNIHEKQHLNMREYKCEQCIKGFNTHKDLRSHKLVVHTDPQSWKYFCKICSKRFPIKSNYDCHMRRHTGDRKFECHLCQKKFTDKCVLQRHMRTHSNVRDHKCPHCEKEYKDKRVLQIHMAKIHGIGIDVIKLPNRERRYFCHICPKAYYAKNKLTRHLYTHSGEKPFLCSMCDKKFNDKSYVKQHLKKAHHIKSDVELT
ncbi:unnamed protein product [Acanthoscelides obtectus]|uniref:C2H2-type domain-containing protein n=1 Tax=Acanthoscelides obtectus TaxID=200917 RepID=A0A9P0KSD8_ACAOB|nr:unnamed protein product [Acanthoscelides obtectus]CAK1661926.1 Zinc finger protein 358 [Acanthoscelides obtectus]